MPGYWNFCPLASSTVCGTYPDFSTVAMLIDGPRFSFSGGAFPFSWRGASRRPGRPRGAYRWGERHWLMVAGRACCDKPPGLTRADYMDKGIRMQTLSAAREVTELGHRLGLTESAAALQLWMRPSQGRRGLW